MDTDREQRLQQIREKAQAISARVKSDPEYRERMKADPARTLAEEGIAESVIPDLLRENVRSDEVSGYIYRNPECNDLTCIISMCPESCYVTI